MAALAAHTKTDSCVPTAMTSGRHDYFQKENYVDDFNKCISDLYKWALMMPHYMRQAY